VRRLAVCLTACTVALGQEARGRAWGAIEPVLREHCYECHDREQHKGKLDLESLPPGADAVTWLWTLAKMRDRVAAGEMPPPGKGELGAEHRTALTQWLARTVRSGAPALPPAPGRVTIRRLTRVQYENTLRDLFGIRTALTAAFPADDLGYGFDNIGDALSFSTLHLEKYLAAAGDAAAQVIDPEDPEHPTARRFPADRMQVRSGSGVNLDGGLANLYTAGEIEQDFTLPRRGVYRLRMMCCGDQAGDEPCRMAVRFDGRDFDEFEVPERKPAEKRITSWLEGGKHRLGLAFVNDYYEPANPDPQRRDRNLKIVWLEVVGPTDARPVPTRQQWLHDADPQQGSPQARLRAVVGNLLLRAWRRPPAGPDVERLVALGGQSLSDGESFRQALRLCVQAVLASPSFLFRAEASAGAPGAIAPVPAFELASRLSFFLWASAPDARLLELAQSGQLRDDAVIAAEVTRMLADPRSEALATDFAAQWLELRNLADRAPDPGRFPGFDDALRAAMRRETELLFLAVLREQRDVRELLDCSFTHVNDRLAAFYGLPAPGGDEFVRVELPLDLRLRGGVLGQAAIAAVTSNPTRTSPVKRGKWVLENLLDAPPPAPPPGNDSFAGEAKIDSAATLREQMAAHRSKASCAACHLRMDALGLAFEKLDAIGRLRERDAGGAIDDRGRLPDGRAVDGLSGLKAVLRDDPAFLRALLHKLFVYAVGREAAPADRVRLWVLAEELRERGKVTLPDLVLAIVRMDAFRLRSAGT
jgi:hypothetical protein